MLDWSFGLKNAIVSKSFICSRGEKSNATLNLGSNWLSCDTDAITDTVIRNHVESISLILGYKKLTFEDIEKYLFDFKTYLINIKKPL